MKEKLVPELINSDLLIKVLKDFEAEAKKDKIGGDRNWTRIIKQKYAQLGRSLGYKTCASGSTETCEPEWLYDLIWYKEVNGRLSEVPMILESEWGMHLDDIRYDFEKLLMCNAPYKIMICQARQELIPKRIEFFSDSINIFQSINDRTVYVIAVLNHKTEEFYYEVIKHKNYLD